MDNKIINTYLKEQISIFENSSKESDNVVKQHLMNQLDDFRKNIYDQQIKKYYHKF